MLFILYTLHRLSVKIDQATGFHLRDIFMRMTYKNSVEFPEKIKMTF